ncbi:phosphatidylglycerophosphatase A [Pelagibacterium montanilacus]|uniref:phosphatidylglycerophosphatase A n=1 Tax=Pelagibacterium montanilacus TaxID=2185280 RepID=UPI000F8F4E6E|nr:phosphatidylglycerophosphatase A [Pelagibacterium montanilacus]
MDDLVELIAHGLGIGHIGLARGPVMGAVTVVLMALLPRTRLAYGAAALLVCVLGFWAAEVADRYSSAVDDVLIVIDEAAGAALLMALVMPRTWRDIALVGLGFWLIDSLKPWPVSLTESVPGATGIMLDDIAVALVVAPFLVVWCRAMERRASS